MIIHAAEGKYFDETEKKYIFGNLFRMFNDVPDLDLYAYNITIRGCDDYQ